MFGDVRRLFFLGIGEFLRMASRLFWELNGFKLVKGRG